MMSFKTFESFMDAEDVRQGYEEDWEDQKEYWTPYLFHVWKEYQKR
jgi:hypothetical protein